MEKLFFYNSKREPIMIWDNFIYNNEESCIYFDVRVLKSIFAASITIKTYLADLAKLKDSLSLLYHQKQSSVAYLSLNEILKMEFISEKSGHIYQKFLIMEHNTRSCLTICDFFDQTFLPELENCINNILLELYE